MPTVSFKLQVRALLAKILKSKSRCPKALETFNEVNMIISYSTHPKLQISTLVS